MYADNFLSLSSVQTVTGTNTSVLSTNTIDLGTARDMGEGKDLYLRSQVGTAFAGATSVEIQAIVADDAALTTNVTVIGSSGAIPLASLTAAARFAVELNPRLGSLGPPLHGRPLRHRGRRLGRHHHDRPGRGSAGRPEVLCQRHHRDLTH